MTVSGAIRADFDVDQRRVTHQQFGRVVVVVPSVEPEPAGHLPVVGEGDPGEVQRLEYRRVGVRRRSVLVVPGERRRLREDAFPSVGEEEKKDAATCSASTWSTSASLLSATASRPWLYRVVTTVLAAPLLRRSLRTSDAGPARKGGQAPQLRRSVGRSDSAITSSGSSAVSMASMAARALGTVEK